MKSEHNSSVLLRSQKDPSQSKAVWSKEDVVTVLTLISLLIFSFAVPRRFWLHLTAGAVRLHRRLQMPDLGATVRCLLRNGVETSESALAQELLAGTYLENLETVAAWVPWRSPPRVEVVGAENIAREQEHGRGVILWHTPFCTAALIEKYGYRKAGIPVTHLRDQAHPYSGTAFGVRILNPIRTRVEDACLADVAWIVPGGTKAALTKLSDVLRANGVISITAIGSGSNAIAVPMLGGTLSLARGATSLAKRTGAAVIPTAVTILPGVKYRVEFGKSLDAEPGAGAKDFQRALLVAYGAWLGARLQRTPGNWRGWTLAHTWQP